MTAPARNLLFITTDQQRWDSLPCYGLDFVRAPHLTRLAAEGLVFDGCFVAAPLCVASRAALMTGLYPNVTGVFGNNQWLEPGTDVWPRRFAKEGFATAAIGKMHFHPWDAREGFEIRVMAEDKRHYYRRDDYTKHIESLGYERLHPKFTPGYYENMGAIVSPLPKALHIDSFVGDQAVRWLRSRDRSRPFSAWVSFPGPHDPYDPPKELAHLYDDAPIPEPVGSVDDLDGKPGVQRDRQSNQKQNPLYDIDYSRLTPAQIRRIRAHYLANVTLIDEQIGKILSALEETGELDETTIVCTSDHGDALGDHGLVFKSFFYESMVRVPLIIRGPGVPAGRRCGALVSLVDLVPFFFDSVGLSAPESQGRSIAPLVRNPDADHREAVFSETAGRTMVRTQTHKYTCYEDGSEELYDLAREPDEVVNRAGDPGYAEVKSELRHRLLTFQTESFAYRGRPRQQPPDPERFAYFEKLEQMEREGRSDANAT